MDVEDDKNDIYFDNDDALYSEDESGNISTIFDLTLEEKRIAYLAYNLRGKQCQRSRN